MSAIEATWTVGNVAILRRLWGEGWSAGQIANYLGGGISRSAVIGKVHRLKLGGRATVVVRPNPTHWKRPEGAVRTRSAAAKPTIAAKPVEKNLPKGNKVADPDADGIRLLRSRAWSALPGIQPVGLTDLCGCRWPIDGENGETLFCNAEAPGKGPYCGTHALLSVPRVVSRELVGKRA